MKYLPIVALVLVTAVTGCEYKHTTEVQPAPSAAVVPTPAPAGSVVYTEPATTTVYTR